MRPTQELVVESDPPGAEVYLKRSGVAQENGWALILIPTSGTKPLDEPFRFIGTTPLRHRFEAGAVTSVGGGPFYHGREHRLWTDGTVRVVWPGGGTSEREVRFRGPSVPVRFEK
jgi:hypothetical protein